MTSDTPTPEEIVAAFEQAQRVWKALVAEEPDAIGLEPILSAIVSEMALVLDKQILLAQPMEVAHAALRAARRVRPLLHDRGLHEAVRKALQRLW